MGAAHLLDRGARCLAPFEIGELFPFEGGHRFVDPESPAERRVEAGRARADFLARFAAARAELARRLTARGIRHAEYVLDEPADLPLRRLFGARASDPVGEAT